MKRVICAALLLLPSLSFAISWQWVSTGTDGVRSYMSMSSMPVDGQGDILIYRMHNWTKAFDTGDRGWARSQTENLMVHCETGMMQRLATAEYSRPNAKGAVVSNGIMGDVQTIQPISGERLFIQRACKMADH